MTEMIVAPTPIASDSRAPLITSANTSRCRLAVSPISSTGFQLPLTHDGGRPVETRTLTGGMMW